MYINVASNPLNYAHVININNIRALLRIQDFLLNLEKFVLKNKVKL